MLQDALLAAQTVAASEQGRVRQLEGSLAEAQQAVAGAQSSSADKLAAAEQRIRSADERVHLAEQVAAAARERASLAEQRVQQTTDAAEERRGWAADLSKVGQSSWPCKQCYYGLLLTRGPCSSCLLLRQCPRGQHCLTACRSAWQLLRKWLRQWRLA